MALWTTSCVSLSFWSLVTVLRYWWWWRGVYGSTPFIWPLDIYAWQLWKNHQRWLNQRGRGLVHPVYFCEKNAHRALDHIFKEGGKQMHLWWAAILFCVPGHFRSIALSFVYNNIGVSLCFWYISYICMILWSCCCVMMAMLQLSC